MRKKWSRAQVLEGEGRIYFVYELLYFKTTQLSLFAYIYLLSHYNPIIGVYGIFNCSRVHDEVVRAAAYWRLSDCRNIRLRINVIRLYVCQM